MVGEEEEEEEEQEEQEEGHPLRRLSGSPPSTRRVPETLQC